MQLRREAEALLAERKGEAQGTKKNGSSSKGVERHMHATVMMFCARATLDVSVCVVCCRFSSRASPLLFFFTLLFILWCWYTRGWPNVYSFSLSLSLSLSSLRSRLQLFEYFCFVKCESSIANVSPCQRECSLPCDVIYFQKKKPSLQLRLEMSAFSMFAVLPSSLTPPLRKQGKAEPQGERGRARRGDRGAGSAGGDQGQLPQAHLA